jgi:hypothetical protein
MKSTLLTIALTLAAPFIWAQTTTTTEKSTTVTPGGTETTTTTKTTTATGTITEFAPGKTIIVKEEGGPRTYTIGKKIVYVTKAGKEIPEAEVRERMRVGAHVHVHYLKEGDGMMVNRVIVDD